MRRWIIVCFIAGAAAWALFIYAMLEVFGS